jgi:oligoendopeptidase F
VHEVASTVNEQLLYHHLLQISSSKEMKKYLLNDHLDSLRSTFFRQTLFAEFEMTAHKLVENNQPLTESVLTGVYKDLYEKYYGKDFVIDKELEYEWARIPHFYSAFYVYQYATGISAAIAIADKILNDKNYDINDYLQFLKSGDSDFSVELLKLAKVDMSRPEPVQATISNFRYTLSELKKM